MKKIWAILFVLMLAMSLVTVAMADEPISGNCGKPTGNENQFTTAVTWSFDSESGTLTISGTGEMANMDTASGKWNTQPWLNYTSQIKFIVVNTGVTSIGQWAFSNNANLESVTLPEGLTTIGNQSIRSNPKLTTITIPASVTSLGNYWMQGNSGITSYTVAEGNPSFVAENGVIFSIDKTVLYNYPAGATATSYTIPDTVTKINNAAFHSASHLQQVTFPTNMTTLAPYSFASCTGLTSVSIPAGVSKIDNQAFNGCTALSSVVLPSGVTEIAQKVFMNCTALTQIVLPDTLGKIDKEAFSGSGLTSVEIPASVTSMARAFQGATYLQEATVYGSSSTFDNTDNVFESCSNLKIVTFAPVDENTFHLGQAIFKNAGVHTIDLSKISKEFSLYDASTNANGTVLNGWLGTINQKFIVYSQSKIPLPTSNTEINGNSQQYAVNAVLGGGTFSDTTSFAADTLAIPGKTNEDFFGWWTKSGDDWDTRLTGAPTANTVYYAKWGTSSYTVPATLELDAFTEGATPVGKELPITLNDGATAGAGDLTAVSDSPAAITAAADDGKVTVTAASGLTAGNYGAVVTVTTLDGAVHQVTVTLTVNAKPTSRPTTTPSTNNTIQSPKTFDAGVAVYAAMALTSAAGAVWVTKKHH